MRCSADVDSRDLLRMIHLHALLLPSVCVSAGFEACRRSWFLVFCLQPACLHLHGGECSRMIKGSNKLWAAFEVQVHPG